ncbi:hypothetical protein Trisim1_012355 [Trichoderma cf. simile WF8]|uniref:Uncharacterized protein n=1 Tax=Trichoderma guizhouense TaxID=1491466 RepID=A0A1T3CJ04_9HYPO|nr:hypothetical protein A0O28_0107770 [Trichoderma guizhouense]
MSLVRRLHPGPAAVLKARIANGRRLEDIGSNDLISCKDASAEIRIVYQFKKASCQGEKHCSTILGVVSCFLGILTGAKSPRAGFSF